MNLLGNKPSPRVIYTSLVVIFLVVFSISYSAYRENNSNQKEDLTREKSFLIAVENNTQNNDADGDSLYDWEEVFWETDPNEYDTDGDGVADGIEITLERDPTIPGPNDKLVITDSTTELNNDIAKTDPNSYTSQVGVSIIERILSSANNPDEILNSDELINEISNQAESLVSLEDKYTANNSVQITVTTDNKEEVLKSYLNTFAEINDSQIDKLTQNPIPTTAQEAGDIFANHYLELSKRLSSIDVPDTLLNLHLSYINSLDKIYRYNDFIRNETVDPILAYSAAPKLDSEIQKSVQSLEQILFYYENNDIIFNEDEEAYVFFK
jgi:hypothetical protein